MNYTLESENVFIPNFDKNKDRKGDEQIKVIYQYPTGCELAATIKSKNVNGQIVIESDYGNLVDSCVLRIENLSVNRKAIKKIEILKKLRGFAKLYSEITTHIITSTSGIEKKT